MNCRCCNNPTDYLFSGNILNNLVKYYECPICKYVQTETPYWLDIAYNSVINDSDTGIISRNIVNSKIVASVIIRLNLIHKSVIDYAGGYGLLVRMLRDIGLSAYWMDLYCSNYFAKNFEHKNSLDCGLVCGFEVMEHVLSPLETIESMLEIAPNILVSTLCMPNVVPKHDTWWYYGKNHGQHIGFFRIKTFQHIAKIKNKHLATDGRSYYLLSDKKISNYEFKLFILLNKVAPYFLKFVLKSKTFSDSQIINI